MSTAHPCVITLDHRSRPRVLFSGDQLVEVDLPAGTRVIYPKPPMKGLADPDAAVRYALSHPLNSAPLFAKLRPGMRVTIAIDDLSMPLPPMKRPDCRQRVLEPVIEMLDEYGVEARIATDPRPISRWAAPGRIEIRVAPISTNRATNNSSATRKVVLSGSSLA